MCASYFICFYFLIAIVLSFLPAPSLIHGLWIGFAVILGLFIYLGRLRAKRRQQRLAKLLAELEAVRAEDAKQDV
jgi:Flp pilus assembly protein TadB